MKKIILITSILIIIVQQAFSVDTNAVLYFPLKVGNIYVYNVHESWYPPPFGHFDTIYTGRVVSDTLINGRKYFLLTGFPKYSSGSWYRVDSTTGSLMKYNPSNSCSYYISESFVDSLAAEEGNNIKNCGTIGSNETFKCIDIDTLVLFNINTQKKIFDYFWSVVHASTNITTRYAKNFGMYYYYYYSQGVYTYWSSTSTLKGCVISGVVYGDTAKIVWIKKISIEIPADFKLHQNYPNPFNPQTKIRFDISKSSHTKLIIYDLLGREVATLVKEELKPGTYEAEWDASDFSSGIYFYKLITHEFVETKKMVLVK